MLSSSVETRRPRRWGAAALACVASLCAALVVARAAPPAPSVVLGGELPMALDGDRRLMAVAPGGSHVAASCRSSEIIIWSTADARESGRRTIPGVALIDGMAGIMLDGAPTFAAVAGAGRTRIYWLDPSGAERRPPTAVPGKFRARGLAADPGGRTVAVFGANVVALASTDPARQLLVVPLPESDRQARGALVSADGGLVALSNLAGWVLLAAGDGAPVAHLATHGTVAGAFLPSGRLAWIEVDAQGAATLHLQSAPRASEATATPISPPVTVKDWRYPDEAPAFPRLGLVALGDTQLLATFDRALWPLARLDLAPDGWRPTWLPPFEATYATQDHRSSFARGGDLVAFATEAGRLLLLSVAALENAHGGAPLSPRNTDEGHPEPIRQLRWSDDGKVIATTDRSNVALWDSRTGRRLAAHAWQNLELVWVGRDEVLDDFGRTFAPPPDCPWTRFIDVAGTPDDAWSVAAAEGQLVLRRARRGCFQPVASWTPAEGTDTAWRLAVGRTAVLVIGGSRVYRVGSGGAVVPLATATELGLPSAATVAQGETLAPEDAAVARDLAIVPAGGELVAWRIDSGRVDALWTWSIPRDVLVDDWSLSWDGRRLAVFLRDHDIVGDGDIEVLEVGPKGPSRGQRMRARPEPSDGAVSERRSPRGRARPVRGRGPAAPPVSGLSLA
ncbi:MAG: WD40 repeat domain-containing protein [Myxococcota bacterium]